MKLLKFTFFILLFCQISFGQNQENIPEGFTKIEDLEYVGKIFFYMNKKTQEILAYQEGKVIWKQDVMKVCGKPLVGKPEIRAIWIKNKNLQIVHGKHDYAKIEIETGELVCEGSD